MMIKVCKFGKVKKPQASKPEGVKSIATVKVVKPQQKSAPVAEVKPSIFNRIINARPLSSSAARSSWSQLFSQEVAA